MMSEEVTITKAIEFAIATEDMGVRAYSKLAERFSEQEEMSSAFSLLAKDEMAHKAQFQAVLDQIPLDDQGVMTKDERSRYLRAMAMSEFFRGHEGLIGKLDKAQNLGEVLVHVLGFEKVTLGYYQAIKDVLGESEALDSIIGTERSHIMRLMNYISTGEKFQGLAEIL
jgi:rubrerythrin